MNQSRWNSPYSQPRERRVVITGLGAVSAAGVGVAALWRALLEGQSGISTITLFDASNLRSRIGGQVRDFDPEKVIEPRMKPRRLARQAQFAVAAAAEAVADAGLDNAAMQAARGGVVLGSALCNADEIAENAVSIDTRGISSIRPTALTAINLQTQATAVTDLLGLENVPAFCVSTACISGIDAVTAARDMICSGRADTVVCGGTDAPLGRTPMTECVQFGMCSTRNDEPERASRPFDRERDNGLMAEGAGIVVLESLDSALERGARPYAEIVGSHTCRDPAGTPAGAGMAQTIRMALKNARCPETVIDYISAWGCGDPTLDRMETRAIKEVFGDHAYNLAVSSIKAVTGNPLGAAGPLQLVTCALAFRHGLLPPTVNFEHRDIDCDLDYIQGAPRRARPRRILLNAHGLGGGNTCVVLAPSPGA